MLHPYTCKYTHFVNDHLNAVCIVVYARRFVKVFNLIYTALSDGKLRQTARRTRPAIEEDLKLT